MKPLPLRIQALLFATAALSFCLSVHLEQNHLDYLDRHPIMVNLISGVVGFSTATLVISVGFNWYAGKEDKRQRKEHYSSLIWHLRSFLTYAHAEAWTTIPEDIAGSAARLLGYADQEDARLYAYSDRLATGRTPGPSTRLHRHCTEIFAVGAKLHEALDIGPDAGIVRARTAGIAAYKDYLRAGSGATGDAYWNMVSATSRYATYLLDHPACDALSETSEFPRASS
ncbi:hypothetical protein AB0K18_35285 [Nonomuraea sp. NPDC049421]|uniref:hypothetical protein n=1 Tax=Nonomuraea sp. NPDC049421 TaxID=3155275 RepID=UPI00343AE949